MSTGELADRTWQGLSIPAPGTFHLDPAHTRVGFVVRHLVVSKVRGAFREVSGEIVIADEPQDTTVTAVIKTDSIDTGVGDRDGHLRSGDFLEAEKYPTIGFRSTGVSGVSGDTFTLTGELTIKDVTRTVELAVEFGGIERSFGRELIGFSATTEIDREDFNVTWNKTLDGGGLMLGNKLKIEIEGEAIRQA
ncbi:YceI family protein [Catellatospora vulcania]|uniref:YceI family protein n=1 Tax=Catellatospora vulcania TaxID=1460450 RepID=UPI0012D3E874|nr:YceI family protein [Catellatospora vulcania]